LYYHICNFIYIFVLKRGYYKRKKALIKLELNREGLLLQLNSKPLMVLHYILIRVNESDYSWYSDKTNRELIMVKLNISRPTLECHLKTLKDIGLIMSTEIRGKYRINRKLIKI